MSPVASNFSNNYVISICSVSHYTPQTCPCSDQDGLLESGLRTKNALLLKVRRTFSMVAQLLVWIIINSIYYIMDAIYLMIRPRSVLFSILDISILDILLAKCQQPQLYLRYFYQNGLD